ncbi:MAG: hypothetical protein J2P16_03400 [Mycobacterium sp.]|nr:hypothetical protein [Mycobacterium sp.]
MTRWRDRYGSHPLHLVTMAAGFALLGYLLVTVKPTTWWNPHSWWQSIAVWFAGAVVAHDLVLFPIYALADRVLGVVPARRRGVSARNHIRIPALGSALALLVFLPGIIRQGAPTYLAATGQTQQPFLGRWLLLTATMFTASAVVYLIKLGAARRAR